MRLNSLKQRSTSFRNGSAHTQPSWGGANSPRRQYAWRTSGRFSLRETIRGGYPCRPYILSIARGPIRGLLYGDHIIRSRRVPDVKNGPVLGPAALKLD
jgi:hypothetical protein